MSLNKRRNGILLHISSLASNYGIGSLGEEAFKFIDFLKETKQAYWQVLPICQPSLSNCPYSAYSSYAGNPLFIDLDLLKDDGLLNKEDYDQLNWGNNINKVDFELVSKNKEIVLKKAVNNYKKDDDYYKFEKDNSFWLKDYALFMTLKEIYNCPWYELPLELKLKDEDAINNFIKEYQDLIDKYSIIQYFFFKQWYKLKEYANNNGIEIIGDIPIYVAYDSAEVYNHLELFDLNEDYQPTIVSGCPPDGFTSEGQKWNNPLYKWENHEKNNYKWWISRIIYLCNIYDVLRIDHFRAFESYFAIPIDKSDKEGYWIKGPGMKLFNELNKNKNDLSLIAEDLGFLTDDVRQLLKDTGYPGMKVLEFGFNVDNPYDEVYKPHTFEENVVGYIGTHDNETLMGYLNGLRDDEKAYIMSYLQIDNPDDIFDSFIESLLLSKANTTILQAQDLLRLDNDSRMNTPSTIQGNWLFRITKDIYDEKVKDKLINWMIKSNRCT